MDRDAFDGLTRLLATTPSRRAALGALLGATLTGTSVAGARNGRARRGKSHQAGRARVSAQGVNCDRSGPTSNVSGCTLDGRDFSGDDLSNAKMVGASFRGATLRGTDLSSSDMKNAIFRGADLTCADLHASMLKKADFRGPSGAGVTDLTGADLSQSACSGIRFDDKTRLCRTRLCDGHISDEDCPGGVAPEGFCCGDKDCSGGRSCVNNRCIERCVPAQCEAGNNACRRCTCAGAEFCACALIACPNGPCDPVTGCPRCVPADCERQNNACQTCSCSGGGFCICAANACSTGPCDPVTGCPPPG